jgi:hypothetical protein
MTGMSRPYFYHLVSYELNLSRMKHYMTVIHPVNVISWEKVQLLELIFFKQTFPITTSNQPQEIIEPAFWNQPEGRFSPSHTPGRVVLAGQIHWPDYVSQSASHLIEFLSPQPPSSATPQPALECSE